MLRTEEVGVRRQLSLGCLAFAGAALLFTLPAQEAGAQIAPQPSIISGNTTGNTPATTQSSSSTNPASAGAPMTPAEMRRFIEFVKMLIVNFDLHFHTAQEWENFLEIAYVFWLIEEDVTPLQPPQAATSTTKQ